jgi:hypothetical protein
MHLICSVFVEILLELTYRLFEKFHTFCRQSVANLSQAYCSFLHNNNVTSNLARPYHLARSTGGLETRLIIQISVGLQDVSGSVAPSRCIWETLRRNHIIVDG